MAIGQLTIYICVYGYWPTNYIHVCMAIGQPNVRATTLWQTILCFAGAHVQAFLRPAGPAVLLHQPHLHGESFVHLYDDSFLHLRAGSLCIDMESHLCIYVLGRFCIYVLCRFCIYVLARL